MSPLWLIALFPAACAQGTGQCSCGSDPPGPPPNRELRPYANEPADLRPFSKLTTPYYEYYTKAGGIQRRCS